MTMIPVADTSRFFRPAQMGFMLILLLLCNIIHPSFGQTSCCDCENTIPINCGETLEGNTANGFTLNDDYSCQDENLTGFADRELIFEINPEKETAYDLDIIIRDFDRVGLDLFLVENCKTDATCIRSKTRTSASPETDTLITRGLDPASTYYLFVDARSGTGRFELSISCHDASENNCNADAQIRCGQTMLLSTSESEDEFSGSFYGALGISSPCSPDNCCEYGHADVVLEFQNDKPQRIQLQIDRLDDFSDTIGVFLVSDLCGTPELLESTEQATKKIELVSDILPRGTYQIIVDRKCVGFVGVLAFDFTIEMNCLDLPTVCDLGGQFIDRGDKIFGMLSESDQASSAFEAFTCEGKEFNFGIGSYAKIYTYVNKEETLDIDLFDSPASTRFFVFSCDCAEDEGCIPNCVGEDDDGFLAIDEATEPFYYIVMIGNETGSLGFQLTPSGPCTESDVMPLSCGQTVNEIDLSDEKSNFNTIEAEFNIYTNCAQQTSKSYQGGDVVFAINLEDVQLATITLTSEVDIGMFLFSQECGSTCLASAEISGGGQVTIDSLPLSGLHYLVVDKAVEDGPGLFDLTLGCEPLEVNYLNFSDTSICSGEPHRVNIQPLDGTSLVNQKPLGPTDVVAFYHQNGDEEILNSPAFRWNPLAGLEFDLIGDLSLDLPVLKCGYALNEPFIIKVIRHENGTISGTPVTAAYAPSIPDSATVEGVYMPNGSSSILRLTGNNADRNFISANLLYKLVSEEGDSVRIIVTSNYSWSVVAGVPWISVSPQSSNFSAPLFISVSPNSTKENRSAEVLIIGSDGLTQSILIEQLGSDMTGINLSEKLGMTISPNPVTGLLQMDFEGSPSIEVIEIANFYGQVVTSWKPDIGRKMQKDISDLSAGIYLVRVKTTLGWAAKKLIKM